MTHTKSRMLPLPTRAGIRQDGIVLIVALIALVVMTLAGLALMRSMDTGLTIAGNAAFKTTATAAADVATDAATTWLTTHGVPATNLYQDAAGGGYYGSWRTSCDMTGNDTPTTTADDVQWDPAGAANAGCGAIALDASSGLPAGYTASFVITRMCTCAGTSAAPGAAVCTGLTNNICAGVDLAGRFHDTPDYAQRGQSGAEAAMHATSSPYYRVVTRVVGPRNTMSFIETVVTLQ